MRSELIFFDNHYNSCIGFYRGLVIFPLVLFICIIISLIEDLSVLNIFLLSLIIVSALGVNNTQGVKGSLLYGLLIGIVIFIGGLLQKSNFSYKSIILGISGTILASWALYMLSKQPSLKSKLVFS